MVFFTTPELMEIGGLPFVSPHDKPTRQEALRYYRRVTDAFALDVRLFEPVSSVAKLPGRAVSRSSPRRHGGSATTRTAAFVVLAAGAYDVPNRSRHSRARICRTSRTTIASRTPSTAAAW